MDSLGKAAYEVVQSVAALGVVLLAMWLVYKVTEFSMTRVERWWRRRRGD